MGLGPLTRRLRPLPTASKLAYACNRLLKALLVLTLHSLLPSLANAVLTFLTRSAPPPTAPRCIEGPLIFS
ncbi:hypothetical protein LOK49_LG05G00078 [Camellia lanceoleosa]|uniref:Uncharacterized protein n=1 Tax=Camellia lanceoleosa TaxID=1840588 RepID=A0ACC0HPJ7_9ERIC|nr:hypothetical protein LOK49_LG05G00078 [Camellia lanceoleosa]